MSQNRDRVARIVQQRRSRQVNRVKGREFTGQGAARRAELPPGVVGDVVDLDVGDGRSERARDTAVDGLVPLGVLVVGVHRAALDPEEHPLAGDVLADVVPSDPAPLLAVEGEGDVLVLHDDAVRVPTTHVRVIAAHLFLLVSLRSGITPVVGAHHRRTMEAPLDEVDLRRRLLIFGPQQDRVPDALCPGELGAHLPPAARGREDLVGRGTTGAPLTILVLGADDELAVLGEGVPPQPHAHGSRIGEGVIAVLLPTSFLDGGVKALEEVDVPAVDLDL